MSTTAPDTIHLKGSYSREEAYAAATIKPGHLIELTSAEKFQVHSTAKGFGEKMFAVEDALIGRPITTDYVADERVSANIYPSGGEVYAWLYPGTNYVVGDKLISKGDGTLQKISGSADLQVFAILKKAVDLSASAAVATRAWVRVL